MTGTTGDEAPLICDVAWCGKRAVGGEIGESGDLLLCAYHLKHPDSPEATSDR